MRHERQTEFDGLINSPRMHPIIRISSGAAKAIERVEPLARVVAAATNYIYRKDRVQKQKVSRRKWRAPDVVAHIDLAYSYPLLAIIQDPSRSEVKISASGVCSIMYMDHAVVMHVDCKVAELISSIPSELDIGSIDIGSHSYLRRVAGGVKKQMHIALLMDVPASSIKPYIIDGSGMRYVDLEADPYPIALSFKPSGRTSIEVTDIRLLRGEYDKELNESLNRYGFVRHGVMFGVDLISQISRFIEERASRIEGMLKSQLYVLSEYILDNLDADY